MSTNKFETAVTLRKAAAATGGAIATNGTTTIANGEYTEGFSADYCREVLFLMTLTGGDATAGVTIQQCPDNLWDANYTENFSASGGAGMRFFAWSSHDVANTPNSPQAWLRVKNDSGRSMTVRAIRRISD